LNYTPNYATSHLVGCICNYPRSKILNSVGEYLDQQRSSLIESLTSYSLVDASELCYATDGEQESPCDILYRSGTRAIAAHRNEIVGEM
jgi:hypothetical protein